MLMSKEREAEQALPERWSARAKSEVVLRLFRGESVDDESREIQVSVHEIETWRKDFLEAGMVGLRRRSGDPDARALRHTQAKVGELTMQLELAEMLLEKKGVRGRAGEVEEVAGLVSAGTGRRYPVTMVCAVWCVPRSTVYTQRGQARRPAWKPQKRGPRTLVSDAVLLEEIRAVLKASAFHTGGPSEGARAVTAPGYLRRQEPGVAAHAAASAAGTLSPPACPWRSGTGGDDHHGAARMSCGGRMRRSSGRSKRVGAGSLERSITAAKTSSAGMWRSAGIAGRRWSRFGRVCSRHMAATHGRSPWVWASAWIGARSTRRISFSGSCAGSGSGRLPAMWASPSATGSWSGGSGR